jgi:hypothetical protein
MTTCQCGDTRAVTTGQLKQGSVVSCRKCAKIKARRRTGYEDIPAGYLSRVRRRATNGGFEFTLTNAFLWELYVKQERKCALSGLPIGFCADDGNINITASLDRIDSTKGYTHDNSQWTHKVLNRMKHAFDQAYFIDLCKLIAANNTTSSSDILPTLNVMLIDRTYIENAMQLMENVC